MPLRFFQPLPVEGAWPAEVSEKRKTPYPVATQLTTWRLQEATVPQERNPTDVIRSAAGGQGVL
jgi:hypothetical protein